MRMGESRIGDSEGVVSASAAERLIVALDFGKKEEALGLVGRLEGIVSFYKVGLELFMAEGHRMLDELVKRNKHIFLDMKMDDVEETISRAVAQVARLNVDFLTILGSGATARAAVKGRGASSRPKILSVTLLTSLNEQDLRDIGLLGKAGSKFQNLEEYVEWRAEQALDSGCDGVITSGQNVGQLSRRFGSRTPRPVFVCPGIRPGGLAKEDHKRPSTPYDAIVNGADYLVVGRPIRNSASPGDTAREIISDIERGLRDRDAKSC
ncbi:MAG: orotidine-5'-phosphate decarboxylase [Candidatus Hydrogenedentes bacterium]|nr:orotidine-5'-phosphate decarboxylase [Candidatus Hydrogenedentota bacterium]